MAEVSFPSCTNQVRHEDPVTARTQYHRLKIKTDEDLNKCHPVLLDWLRRPVLADSVRQFTFEKSLKRNSFDLSNGDETFWSLDHLSQSEDETLVVDAVKKLGLDDDTENKMISTLLWKGRLITKHSSQPEKTEYRKLSRSERDWSGHYAHSVATLLLSLAANVETLKIMEPANLGRDSPMTKFLIKSNYRLLGRFCLQKLQYLKFTADPASPYNDERYYVNFDTIGSLRLFHRLPEIEIVTMSAKGEDPEGRTILFPHTSHLKRFKIDHSDISSATLAAIIRLPKALEEFTYSFGGRATNDGSHSSKMLPKTLGKAFLTQKRTLRKLGLDLDECLHSGMKSEQEDVGDEHYPEWVEEQIQWQRDEYWEMDEASSTGSPFFTKDLETTREYGTTIGSLHDFSSLTHLSIGVKLLLGANVTAPFRLVDALPKTLEMLCIRGYVEGENDAYDSQIHEFIEQRKDKCPHLEDIWGLEEEIPSEKTLTYGEIEDDSDLLWVEEEEDDGWLEVT